MSETKERTRSRTRDSKGKKPVKQYSDVVDTLQDVLKGIPDRPTKGLMTFEELQAKIGAAPKKNRLFGLKKMSTRYKAIGERLAELKAKLANATLGDIADEGGRQAFEKDLNDQLDEIDNACQRYQKKHTGKKGQAVQGLRDDADRFRKEIGPTLDALTEGGDEALPEDLPVDQAIALKRAGIKPGQLKGISLKHCDFAKFNNETSDRPGKVLGQGAVNTVESVSHGGVERVFKKEQQKDTSGAWAPGMMGIDTQNDPRYGNRNVASGMLGKLLGTGVMPQSTFAISGGEVGLLMDKAPGKTLRKMMDSGELEQTVISPKLAASLQQQLMDLEVCDILTGQTDRHPGNYMVDIQGDKATITGIDNDFAFPAKGAISKDIPPKFMGMNSVKNLPALMSKTVADNIKAINFDRDIAPQLQGLLRDDEIEGTKQRVETLQAHVQKLEGEGYIVSNWEAWRAPPPDQTMTATDYLAEINKTQKSLFVRDFMY